MTQTPVRLSTSELAHACELKHRLITGLDWLRSHRDSPHLRAGQSRLATIASDYVDELTTIDADLTALRDDLLQRLERGWVSTHPNAGERFAERVAQYEVVVDTLNPRLFADLMERIDRACLSRV